MKFLTLLRKLEGMGVKEPGKVAAHIITRIRKIGPGEGASSKRAVELEISEYLRGRLPKKGKRQLAGVEEVADPYVPGSKQDFFEKIVSPPWERSPRGTVPGERGHETYAETIKDPEIRKKQEKAIGLKRSFDSLVQKHREALRGTLRPLSGATDKEGLHDAAEELVAVSRTLSSLEDKKWETHKQIKDLMEKAEKGKKLSPDESRELSRLSASRKDLSDQQYRLLQSFVENPENPLVHGKGLHQGVSDLWDKKIKTYDDIVRRDLEPHLTKRFNFLLGRAYEDVDGMGEGVRGPNSELETQQDLNKNLDLAVENFKIGNFAAAFHLVSAVSSGAKGFSKKKHMDMATRAMTQVENLPEHAEIMREPDMTEAEKYKWKSGKAGGGSTPPPMEEREKEAYEARLADWRGEETRLKRKQMEALSTFAKRPWEDQTVSEREFADRPWEEVAGITRARKAAQDPMNPRLEGPLFASEDLMKPQLGGEDATPNSEIVKYVKALGSRKMIRGGFETPDEEKRNRVWQLLLGRMAHSPEVMAGLKRGPVDPGVVEGLVPKGSKLSPQSLELLRLMGVVGGDVGDADLEWTAVEGWLSRMGAKL